MAQREVQSTTEEAPPQISPVIVDQFIFPDRPVRVLKTKNFRLNEPWRVGLDSPNCTLILFYGSNGESRLLAEIWALAANQITGPIFGACNLFTEKKVAQAFNELHVDNNHPLHWASLRGIPFIMVYREHWPVAFYNGSRDLNSIIEYAITTACKTSYREPVQLAAGYAPDGPDYGIPSPSPYIQDVKTDSTQFTYQQPIRSFGQQSTPQTEATRGEQVPVPAQTGG